MTSRTTAQFRRCFAKLPQSVRRQARDAFSRFLADPANPGLRFKRVHQQLPVFSARVTIDYRAVGVRDGDEMIWFWIGSHADYEKILAMI